MLSYSWDFGNGSSSGSLAPSNTYNETGTFTVTLTVTDEIELVGYYIPQPDGSVLEGGYGYKPNSPYGGTIGVLTFWASEDIGYTEVSLNNEYVGTIGNYWPEGLSCDQPGALNVTRPDGVYILTAESSNGYYWEGTIYFTEGICDTVELTLNKKGASGTQRINQSVR